MHDNHTSTANPCQFSIFNPCPHCNILPVKSYKKKYATCGFCNYHNRPLKIKPGPPSHHTCRQLVVVHRFLLLHEQDPTTMQVPVAMRDGITVTYTYSDGYLHPDTPEGLPFDLAVRIPITKYDVKDHRKREESRDIVERMLGEIKEGHTYPKRSGRRPTWRRNIT